MITKEQLLEFRRLKRLNMGQAEKDYLIDLLLYAIASNTRDELVFKGGTCLKKVHNLDRFSEDLDFTQVKEISLNVLSEKLIRDLKYFSVEATATQKRVYDSVTIKFRVKGPLYTGDEKMLAALKVDVNTKSSVILKPESVRISSLYPEIPSVHVLVMDGREILAEKIRALLTRVKARDLYDIKFLLERETPLDRKLVENKLEYYNETLDLRKIEESISKLQGQWAGEIKALVENPPDYGVVAGFVLGRMREGLS